MDSNISNASVVVPVSVIQGEQRLGLPPWESMSISQVLLPVLCAIFIAAVIIVIAFCLIQKKPKSSEDIRQKSCHTMETSHDLSEQEIYDVIDEVNARSFSPDKIQRRHEKMDSSCTLQSKYLPHPTLSNLFIKKTPAMSTCAASKFDLLASRTLRRTSSELVGHQRDSVSIDARLSTFTNTSVSCTDNEDEGIYETLDRHWAFKSDQNEKGNLQTADRKLILLHRDAGCCDNATDSSHKQNENSLAPNPEGLSESFNCQLGIMPQNVRETLQKAFSSSQNSDTRKVFCQISMFEITNSHDIPALIETSYYQVQSQIQTLCGQKSENIPAVFNNSNLRIVQDGVNNNTQERDLVLKPVMEKENHQKILNSQCEISEKTNTHEKLCKSQPEQCPVLLVKKSESFRDTTSAVSSLKQHHRCRRRNSDSSDIDKPVASSKTLSRQANISAGPEATRILTKLGPLPPVPVFRQDSYKKAMKSSTSKKSLLEKTEQLNSSKNCECSLKPSLLSVMENHLPFSHDLETNSKLLCTDNTNMKEEDLPLSGVSFNDTSKNNHEDFPAHFDIVTNSALTSNEINNECLHEANNLVAGDNIVRSNCNAASTHRKSTLSTSNACNNDQSQTCCQETNHYFVLEARICSSSSCGNSDTDDIS